jgi:hypothetical protein
VLREHLARFPRAICQMHISTLGCDLAGPGHALSDLRFSLRSFQPGAYQHRPAGRPAGRTASRKHQPKLPTASGHKHISTLGCNLAGPGHALSKLKFSLHSLQPDAYQHNELRFGVLLRMCPARAPQTPRQSSHSLLPDAYQHTGLRFCWPRACFK